MAIVRVSKNAWSGLVYAGTVLIGIILFLVSIAAPKLFPFFGVTSGEGNVAHADVPIASGPGGCADGITDFSSGCSCGGCAGSEGCCGEGCGCGSGGS